MNVAVRTTLTLALALGGSAHELLGQSSVNLPLRLATVSPVATRVASYDPTTVRARIGNADALFLEGRISAARREYEAVIEMQRSAGVFPSEAMWKLAELYQSENATKRTASVLNELAIEAERYGDPQMQARALLEAAVLFQKAHLRPQAAACADRLDSLMASPFVSDGLRAEVARRIVRK